MPVTRADADHVQRAFDVFNERFEALRGDALGTYHAEFFVSDSIIHNADGFPMPATYEGFPGYRRWFDDSYGPYRDVQWAVDSLEIVGDRVIAVGAQRRARAGRPDVARGQAGDGLRAARRADRAHRRLPHRGSGAAPRQRTLTASAPRGTLPA